MSRLDRSGLVEIAQAFGAWFGLMLVLLLALAFLRGTDVLLGAGVGPADLAEFFVLVAPQFIAQAAPVAFLLAVLLVYGRWSDDGEWAALQSLGVARHRLLVAPVVLGVLLAGALAWVGIVWQPWGLKRVSSMVAELVQRNVTGDVRPGEFHEEILGFTLYVGARDADGRWKDVLLADERDPAAPLLVLASQGRVTVGVEREASELVLGQGELHRAGRDADENAMVAFEQARFRLDLSESVFQKSRQRSQRDELGWGELHEAEAEAIRAGAPSAPFAVARHWRLGQAFAPIAFAVLAVALALGGRGGRTRGVVLTLAAWVTFYLVARATVSLGERGALPAWVAGQGPNAVVAALGGGLLWVRGVLR